MARAYFKEPEKFIPGYYMISGQEHNHPPLKWVESWDAWCDLVDHYYAKYGMYRVDVTDAGDA
jgi:hypothetical protein